MMRKLSIAIATSLVAAAALVAAAPASAQRMSLAERVSLLEQQTGNNQATVDLLRQVNLLKEEVTALRSQIEQLTHDQEQLQGTARAQYLDLDGRIDRLQGGSGTFELDTSGDNQTTPVTPPASRAGTAAAPVDTTPAIYGDPGKLDQTSGEREAYDVAFDALRTGEYVESARLFHSFLGHYPDGAYAPNALYWLGESYYVTQNYQLALDQFEALRQRYPTHDKAPGAMLKVGLSQQGLAQFDAAEKTLTEVTERYPGTDSARIATDRLSAIQLGRIQ